MKDRIIRRKSWNLETKTYGQVFQLDTEIMKNSNIREKGTWQRAEFYKSWGETGIRGWLISGWVVSCTYELHEMQHWRMNSLKMARKRQEVTCFIQWTVTWIKMSPHEWAAEDEDIPKGTIRRQRISRVRRRTQGLILVITLMSSSSTIRGLKSGRVQDRSRKWS